MSLVQARMVSNRQIMLLECPRRVPSRFVPLRINVGVGVGYGSSSPVAEQVNDGV